MPAGTNVGIVDSGVAIFVGYPLELKWSSKVAIDVSLAGSQGLWDPPGSLFLDVPDIGEPF